MTRKSKRELESAVEDLGAREDSTALDDVRVVTPLPGGKFRDLQADRIRDADEVGPCIADFTGDSE